jgi:hypothetical protein
MTDCVTIEANIGGLSGWCHLDIVTTVATMDASTAINITFTGLSAAAAVGSVIAAVWSRNSGERAAVATAELTAIEKARRQIELTPRFRLILTEGDNGLNDLGRLDVELIGPAGLDYLDEVTIMILDEVGADHWGRGLPTGVSQEEADSFVWGPWEFNDGATEQVATKRITRSRRYSRLDGKNWDRLALKRTRPGHWMTPDSAAWQRDRSGPVRVSISCRRAPFDAWFLLCDVDPGENEA